MQDWKNPRSRYILHSMRNGKICAEHKIAVLFKKSARTLGIAESCTGGLVSNRVTDVPGSSEYFKGAIIAYSNDIKVSVLGVPKALIKEHGAVSSEVVGAMARGARRVLRVDVAGAITGIAGPLGGTSAKPVGLAYVAVADKNGTKTKKILIKGNRKKLKFGFSEALLGMVLKRYISVARDP